MKIYGIWVVYVFENIQVYYTAKLGNVVSVNYMYVHLSFLAILAVKPSFFSIKPYQINFKFATDGFTGFTASFTPRILHYTMSIKFVKFCQYE